MQEQNLMNDIEQLKEIKRNLQQEIIELDDKILYQDFGIYQPQYNFASLDNYKNRLQDIRKEQKDMIDKHLAVCKSKRWFLEGSEKQGVKLINNCIKQMLRNFNIECDLVINKVKFNNYESSKERIFKSFEIQNKFNELYNLTIADGYYKLKIQELNLAFEYEKKKQEEKERIRQERETHKEELRVLREIEEKRKEYEKEQLHYENAMKKIEEQLSVERSKERKIVLEERKIEINNNLIDVDKAMKDLDYREANHRAGYVYIISNIGAFGENVFKIGMTRRLEPEERIAELSGASVPFKFDIHAMIFSDDAPKLEAALHNKFANKKLNLINGRKEFFKVSLDEIKNAVRDNFDKTVDFIDVPEAEQFRESIMMRRND